jgi:hypothetical protein
MEIDFFDEKLVLSKHELKNAKGGQIWTANGSNTSSEGKTYHDFAGDSSDVAGMQACFVPDGAHAYNYIE